MQVLSKRTLRDFWTRHRQVERPLASWFKLVSKASWDGPADVKKAFGGNVDFIGGNRIIFDIGGNETSADRSCRLPVQACSGESSWVRTKSTTRLIREPCK